MNRVADYKTLQFNNESLHFPFFFSLPFLLPIPFWRPTPNNLSPFNDMQMNFHEPHDPVRWLNWDDISCHAAATVSVSVCLLFFSPISTIFPPYPRQQPTGDIKGFIVTIPSRIFFVSDDILTIRCYFREVFPHGIRRGASWCEMLALTSRAVVTPMLEQYTIIVMQ